LEIAKLCYIVETAIFLALEQGGDRSVVKLFIHRKNV